MRLLFFSLFMLLLAVCCAQPAEVGLKIGTRVRVQVTNVTDIQLFTTTETYNLDQIQAIYFLRQQPDSISILTLRANGVAVYIDNKRLPPIPKPKEDNVTALSTGVKNSNASLGIGLGLDYGGIGGRLGLLPTSPVGFFIGAGYNLDKLGYNAGIDIKFRPKERTTVFVSAMYGYNTVLLDKIDGYDNTYYGVSAGFGFKAVNKQNGKDYFTLQFIVPFRDSEIKTLIDNSNLFAMPVLFSLGYNFGF